MGVKLRRMVDGILGLLVPNTVAVVIAIIVGVALAVAFLADWLGGILGLLVLMGEWWQERRD